MKSQSLSQVQLFVTKRPRLEKNVEKIYADSQDADTVIQYVVAALIRHALCISDFSLFCQDIIKEILLFAEPTEVLQKLAPLFRGYFDNSKEWEQVTHRLYKKSKIYHRYNNRVSECKKYLFAKTTPAEMMGRKQYKLVSTFEDAVGKIHTWSLRDADPNASAMKISAVLELLSSLTIFERDGVRRFVQLENSEIDDCTRYLKIRNGEIVEEAGPILTSQEQVETGDSSAQLKSEIATLSEEERLALVEMLLPEGIVLADARSEEPAIIMSEKETSNDGTVASKNAVATSQETVPTEGKVTPTVKATSNKTENSVAKKTPTRSDSQKANSEKQEVVEKKEEPQKKTKKGKKGKNNSKKGKGKDRKRRRRK